jgi:hypothetical protein
MRIHRDVAVVAELEINLIAAAASPHPIIRTFLSLETCCYERQVLELRPYARGKGSDATGYRSDPLYTTIDRSLHRPLTIQAQSPQEEL